MGFFAADRRRIFSEEHFPLHIIWEDDGTLCLHVQQGFLSERSKGESQECNFPF